MALACGGPDLAGMAAAWLAFMPSALAMILLGLGMASIRRLGGGAGGAWIEGGGGGDHRPGGVGHGTSLCPDRPARAAIVTALICVALPTALGQVGATRSARRSGRFRCRCRCASAAGELRAGRAARLRVPGAGRAVAGTLLLWASLSATPLAAQTGRFLPGRRTGVWRRPRGTAVTKPPRWRRHGVRRGGPGRLWHRAHAGALVHSCRLWCGLVGAVVGLGRRPVDAGRDLPAGRLAGGGGAAILGKPAGGAWGART